MLSAGVQLGAGRIKRRCQGIGAVGATQQWKALTRWLLPHLTCPAAGLPTFMLVVNALVSTMRQCGACLTSLDAERGERLHAYYKAVRKSGRLDEPVEAP